MSVLDKIKNQELTVLVGENDGYGTHLNNSSKYTNELLELAEIGERMRLVSVNDRLPTEDDEILIYNKHKDECIVGKMSIERPSFEESFTEFEYFSTLDGDEIEWDCATHWMPLPALPVDEN